MILEVTQNTIFYICAAYNFPIFILQLKNVLDLKKYTSLNSFNFLNSCTSAWNSSHLSQLSTYNTPHRKSEGGRIINKYVSYTSCLQSKGFNIKQSYQLCICFIFMFFYDTISTLFRPCYLPFNILSNLLVQLPQTQCISFKSLHI